VPGIRRVFIAVVVSAKALVVPLEDDDESAQRNAKEAFFRMILIVYNNTPQLFCENLK